MDDILAFGMTYDEFCQLYDECNGFNTEFYKNHKELRENESFLDFLLEGSKSLVGDPLLKNTLG